MKLTQEQQALLNGEKGQTMAKVMKTLVMYGEIFGAEKMVPVTSTLRPSGHLLRPQGPEARSMTCMDQLHRSRRGFRARNSRRTRGPLDPNVPAQLSAEPGVQPVHVQASRRCYEGQLEKPWRPQATRTPSPAPATWTRWATRPAAGRGAHRGRNLPRWSTPTRVLGARCNRNSGIMDLMGSIAGCVPSLRPPDRRRAARPTGSSKVRTTEKPEAAAARLRHRHEGDGGRALCRWVWTSWLGNELDDDAMRLSEGLRRGHRLQRRGGPVPHRWPHPRGRSSRAETLIRDGAQVYVIDDAELQPGEGELSRWCGRTPDAKPKLCFMGCPAPDACSS